MPYPERLDPREVLAHLHQLGYHNISSHQLKDFIHDLKKLIKHEQRLKIEADKDNINNSNFSSNDSCRRQETKVMYLENESDSVTPGSSDVSDTSSTITECTCTSESSQVKRYSCLGSQDIKGTKVQRPQSSCEF